MFEKDKSQKKSLKHKSLRAIKPGNSHLQEAETKEPLPLPITYNGS